MPQIEVTFDIDANGILNVSAKDKATGREQHITITSSSGLSKDEVSKMVHNSERYAGEDKRRREEVETRNTANSLAFNAERTLRDLGEKAPANMKANVEARVANVRAALATDDLERVKAASDALTQALHKLATQVYSAAPEGAGTETGEPSGEAQEAPGATNEGGDGGEGETVEGQYKEV